MMRSGALTDATGAKGSFAGYAILFLFTVSGAAALVYEVVWVRQLTLVLGASTHAVTIILAAFMSGMGIGSWYFGKRADLLDRNGLARYFVCMQLGLAFYALCLPWFNALQQHAYVWIYHTAAPSPAAANGIKLVFSFLTLLFPTILMGATLPLLSRYVIRSQARMSVSVSRLYAANTLGAVMGTVAAGYFLLPAFGNARTNMLAVCANLLVAGGFWLLHGLSKQASLPSESSDAKLRAAAPALSFSRIQTAAVVAICFSGAAAMFYQVAWTRTLTMILGTTTFAFTTMLATFLLGLGLGSALYGAVRKLAAPPALFVGLQLLIALSVLLTIPLFALLPFAYLSLNQAIGGGWHEIQFIRFALAMSIMFVPTFAMGCIFPVVAEILVAKVDVLGARVGKAYCSNTFGAVAGAVLAGLALVPLVGMQRTIMLGACLNLFAGGLVLLARADISINRRFATAGGTAVVFASLALVLQPWSPNIMSSGVYAYSQHYEELLDRIESAGDEVPEALHARPWELWKMAMEQYDVLYYKTGQVCTVSVMERGDGVRFLTVDGKTDASTSTENDMKTQILLAQLPLLFHKSPDQVFVVGLGSGVTVGSALTHDVRVVDCAEYSPAVIEAAQFFSHVNHSALDDKRLRILQRDARNILLTSQDRYDVIISQPSNPWISGQSSLFSLEWYELVRDHLREDGLFAQWVPAYCMAEQDVKIIIHTLRSVFPNLTAWTSGSSGELIFIASKGGPLEINYSDFKRRVASRAVSADVERLGYIPQLLPFITFTMSQREVNAYLHCDENIPLRKNVDDLLITEFSAPKQLTDVNVVDRFATAAALRGDISELLGIMPDVAVDELEAIASQYALQ